MTLKIPQLLTVCFVIASNILGYAPQAQASHTADAIEILEQVVQIGTGDRPLFGTLTLPKVGHPVPCVVLIQGVGAHDRDYSVGPNRPFMELARGLASQGVAALRYDKRNFAYPDCMLDKEFDINQETLNDAINAVNLTRNIPSIDNRNIFLCGHSMGGILIPILAERIPDLKGAIILSSPGRSISDILQNLSKEQRRVSIASFNPRSLWQIQNINVPLSVSRLTLPIFVAQGGTDQIVSVRDGLIPWQTTLISQKTSSVFVSFYPFMNHALLELPNESMSLFQQAHVAQSLITDLGLWIHTRCDLS